MSRNLAAFLLLLVSLDSSSYAVTRPEITATYTSAAFSLDGDAAEWTGVKARGEGISFYKGDGHTGTSSNLGTTICRTISNEADCRVDLWLAHDATYLYVLAEVRDDSHEPFTASNQGNYAYLEDTLHLYLDSTNSKTSGISDPPIYYRMGYEQFGISTDGNIYGENTDFNSPGTARHTAPLRSQPDGSHWAADCGVESLAEGGYRYTFEERIALAAYRNMAALSPGESYGFNAEFCDADNGVQLQGYIWWSSYGSVDAYVYENLWGTMSLEAVPEPSSLAMAAGAMALLPAWWRLHRRRSRSRAA